MRAVSGEVIATKPISLSKATAILSNFVSIETGASHAFRAYLRRASASFNDLNLLHKELRASKSERKHKRSKSDATHEDSVGSFQLFHEQSEGKRHTKKKKRGGIENTKEAGARLKVESLGLGLGRVANGSEERRSEEKKKKKRKRRKSEGDN